MNPPAAKGTPIPMRWAGVRSNCANCRYFAGISLGCLTARFMGLDCDGVRLVLFDNVKSHRDGGVHSRIGYVPGKALLSAPRLWRGSSFGIPQRGRRLDRAWGCSASERGWERSYAAAVPAGVGRGRYARGSYEKTRGRG